MKKLSILLILMAFALSLAACAEEPAPVDTVGSSGPGDLAIEPDQLATEPEESAPLTSPPSSYNESFVWNDDIDDVLGTWKISYYEVQTDEGTFYTDSYSSIWVQYLASEVHFERDWTGYVINMKGDQISLTWTRRRDLSSDRDEIAIQFEDGDWIFYYDIDSADPNYRTLSDNLSDSNNVVYYYLHKTESFTTSNEISDENVTVDGDNYILGPYTFQKTTLTVDGQTYSGWALTSFSAVFDEAVIPSTVLGEPVIAIASQAFYGHEFLTSVTLPETLISIGNEAFANCRFLKTVTIPDGVREIGYGAFYDSYTLTEIILPDSVTSLGEDAFTYCSSLTTLQLSDSLTELSPRMLWGTNVTFLEVPEGITKLSYKCFSNAELKSIVLPSTLTELEDDVLGEYDDMSSITGECTVEKVFFRGTQEQCPQALLDQLAKINVPIYYLSETEPAEEGNYWRYVDGQPVIYRSEETPPEEEAPAESAEEKYRVMNRGRKIYRVGACDYREITLLIDGQEFFGMALVDCNQVVENLVIPEEINGLPVIAVYFDYAWSTNELFINTTITSFESVVIPETVLYIGDYNFNQCKKLKDVTLPASLKWIGDYAFNQCTKLTQLNLPSSLKWIGDYAFNQCTKLTQLNLPSSLKWIGDYAFNQCTKLTDLAVPSSVKWIGSDAFYNCPGLTTLRITKDLQLNYGALDGAINLTTVILEEGVTQIPVEIPDTVTTLQLSPDMTELPAQMLAGTQVTFLEVYEGVTKLGDSCFANETLEQIILPSTLAEIGSDLFKISLNGKSESFEAPVRQVFFRGTAEQCPQELLDYLKEICVPIYYLSETEPAEEGNFWYYVDGQPVIW